MTLSPGCGTPRLTVSMYSGSTLENLARAREFTQGSWELWALILSLVGVPSTARSDSRAQQVNECPWCGVPRLLDPALLTPNFQTTLHTVHCDSPD